MEKTRNEKYVERLEQYKKLRQDKVRLYDYVSMGRICYQDGEVELGRKVADKARKISEEVTRETKSAEFYEIFVESLRVLAAYYMDFDSYLLYVEHKRDPKEQFYLPRRPQLKKVVDELQHTLNGELDLLTISLPPGTGKTALITFFNSYICGLWPNGCSIASSYSSNITGMFYKSCLDIIVSDEYAWGNVFPNVPFNSKSDKEQYINMDKFRPFKTLTCRSIDGTITGGTRCDKFLICDDMVSGIEEAMNLDRMDGLYRKYTDDLSSRKKEGCREVHLATRWSVHDIIGRLENLYGDSDRAKFIAVPCYNEDGESNFQYKYGVGFSTEFFRDQEKKMDEISFRCLYLNDPIERDGLLYDDKSLLRYLGGLPVDDNGEVLEPDAILGCCDTKDTGTDYNCLLIVYQYGDHFYLEDLVYNNGSPYVLDELNANCLVKNKVQKCQFESNKEGSRTANEVQRIVKEKGGRCFITKKYTSTNKETKIIVNSDWVKQHIYFKDKSEYTINSEYGKFMHDVCSYVQMGKNKHDDSVDCLAMLALFIQSLEGTKVRILNRDVLGI